MSEPDDYVSPPLERVGTLACIEPAELARLRRNSERWEWVSKTDPATVAAIAWRIPAAIAFGDPDAAVDAAIAAEKKVTE